MIVSHYEKMLGFYGKDLGLRVARKHLGWYMERADVGLRRLVLTAREPADVISLIPEAIDSVEALAA